MDNNVSYLVHEGVVARLERTNKRIVFALIMSIFLLFASNMAWLWVWTQYDYSSEATTTETSRVIVDAEDGNANYIGNDGSIVNGTGGGDGQENNDQTQDTQ